MHHVRGSVPCPPGHWGDDLAYLGTGKLMKLLDWLLILFIVAFTALGRTTGQGCMMVMIFFVVLILGYRWLMRQEV